MDRPALELRGFRRERGLLWPDYDRRCAEVTFAETSNSIPKILPYLTKFRSAVQAGGNCGQLVRLIAKAFRSIYTFEPDHLNFVALTVNTAEFKNVFRFQSFLGCERKLSGIEQGDKKFPQNCGALFSSGSGSIPTMKIDDLGLSDCDLILIDIEGAEASAIKGAMETISRSRPVIVIEDKNLGVEFFGEMPHAAEKLLLDVGYRKADRVGLDTIMVQS